MSKAPKALRIILYAVVLALVLTACAGSGGDRVERFAEGFPGSGANMLCKGRAQV